MNKSGASDSDSYPGATLPEPSKPGYVQLRAVMLLLFGVGVCAVIVTWVLREPPPQTDVAVTGALQAIRSADPADRVSAIRDVTQLGLADSAHSIPAVVDALADSDAAVRARAAESLGILGSYAVWARMTGTVADGQDQGTIESSTKALVASMASDTEPSVRPQRRVGWATSAQLRRRLQGPGKPPRKGVPRQKRRSPLSLRRSITTRQWPP